MIEIMSTRPLSFLFPRLQCLQIGVRPGPQFGPIIMHHSIETFTVGPRLVIIPMDKKNFIALARHASDRMPNLTTLDLDVPHL